MTWRSWLPLKHKRAVVRLAQREQRFATLVDHAVGGVLLCDVDGTIRDAALATHGILGISPEELNGSNLFDLLHPDDRDQARTDITALIAAGTDMTCEPIRASHHDGAWRWLAMSGHNMLADPDIGALVFNFQDITRWKEREDAQRSDRLLFDSITGLPNRVLLADRIERAVLVAARAKESLAVLLLNIDRFKDVNDALGHTTGDSMLRLVAERLQAALRASDTFARLVGDEFVALLPRSDDESAAIVADRIERALEEPFVLGDNRIALSASMGISFYPRHGKDGEELLQHADVALQHARALGLSRAIYRSEADAHTMRRLGLRAELRDAIEQDGLSLYYQPKLTLQTGGVAEVEALVRWIHPAHGFVPPSEFIPIAERWNTIRPLTLWVLGTAIRQAHAWSEAGLNLAVAVNLSARDLQDQELPGAVSDLLAAEGVEGRRLLVEVTESMLMIDPERARFILDQLRTLGIKISIDDFGTGYSSLAYLSRLPLDELKIDIEFVAGIARSDHDRFIVASTIELGHRLGLSVTAEGVEDQPTQDLLASMQCDKIQGYHVARPLAAADLVSWMEARRQPDAPSSDDRLGTGHPDLLPLG
jgi:diguanylate cyclase (GGDEF)-like protein/PAS domain S-box-containing protein